MTPSKTPPLRIVLVRHGRSSHVHRGWIDSEGFRAWREAYEAAGIREGEQPPERLRELAEGAGLLIASDAPRAIESARRLGGDREVVVSPLLRELSLQAPNLGRLRLPLPGWALAVGSHLLLRKLRREGLSDSEMDRVRRAAAWLEEGVTHHSSLIAVSHASFRRHLAARLLNSGWAAEGSQRSLRPWSAWIFRRSATALF